MELTQEEIKDLSVDESQYDFIGTESFHSSIGSDEYRLAVKPNEYSYPSANAYTIEVHQRFKSQFWRKVPSGWDIMNVFSEYALAIDFGQNWIVYPSPSAWHEIPKEFRK